jgi:hypothetical protein
MTFAKGAALKDPSRFFNASLEGNTRHAIDFRESEKIDAEALKTLIEPSADALAHDVVPGSRPLGYFTAVRTHMRSPAASVAGQASGP